MSKENPYRKLRELEIKVDGEPVTLVLFNSPDGVFAMQADVLDDLEEIYNPYSGEDVPLDPEEQVTEG